MSADIVAASRLTSRDARGTAEGQRGLIPARTLEGVTSGGGGARGSRKCGRRLIACGGGGRGREDGGAERQDPAGAGGDAE